MPCRSSPKRLFAAVIGSPFSLNASPQPPPTHAPLASRPTIDGRPCQSSLNACALLARRLGELDECCSRRLPGQDRDPERGGEIEACRFAIAPQVDPLRIDAGHSPARSGTAEQAGSMPGNRVAMVFIHVF